MITRSPDKPALALLCMTGSAFGFSTMAIFVKSLAPSIPQFELVFVRSLVNLAVATSFMLWARESFLPSGKPLLLFRGLVGFGGIACLFYSISHLPLPIAMMLSWCSPIFVILFSAIFLRERMRPIGLVPISVAFVGLYLLLNPGSASSEIPIVAALVGLAGAAFGAMAYTAVRAATARVGVNTIIFYFVAVSTVLSLPPAMATWVQPTPSQWIGLVCMGVLASAAQFFMTQAYRFAPASVVSTMNLLNAGFAALYGLLLFDEWLSAIQWAGMLLLVSAVASLTLLSARILAATSPRG